METGSHPPPPGVGNGPGLSPPGGIPGIPSARCEDRPLPLRREDGVDDRAERAHGPRQSAGTGAASGRAACRPARSLAGHEPGDVGSEAGERRAVLLCAVPAHRPRRSAALPDQARATLMAPAITSVLSSAGRVQPEQRARQTLEPEPRRDGWSRGRSLSAISTHPASTSTSSFCIALIRRRRAGLAVVLAQPQRLGVQRGE